MEYDDQIYFPTYGIYIYIHIYIYIYEYIWNNYMVPSETFMMDFAVFQKVSDNFCRGHSEQMGSTLLRCLVQASDSLA